MGELSQECKENRAKDRFAITLDNAIASATSNAYANGCERIKELAELWLLEVNSAMDNLLQTKEK